MAGEGSGRAAQGREPIRSPAWLLKGLTGSTPGLLELAEGRLSFSAVGGYSGAPGTRSDERSDHAGRVFETAVSNVTDVTFPWYYFGAGAKLTIGEQRYRLSFSKPGNTQLHEEQLGANVAMGREAGKMWRSVLSRRTA